MVSLSLLYIIFSNDKYIPGLKSNDPAGERVVGRGSDLYQLCKDIDDTIKGIFLL